VLLFAGIERIRINPSDNPFLDITFEWYPWTHSLLAALVWGALAALGYWGLRRDRTGSTVVGMVVVSHWVLALIADAHERRRDRVGSVRRLAHTAVRLVGGPASCTTHDVARRPSPLLTRVSYA
jgi:hypothetical protein